MSPAASLRVAILASCTVAVAAAFILDRFAPGPAADVSRGTEDCFAEGLLEREMPPPLRTPQRWTEGRALLRFRHLPAGPAIVRVGVHGHRAPVFVAVNGRQVGAVSRRTHVSEFPASVERGGALDVELRVEPFVASGGRRLGALLDRVEVEHAPARFPGLAIVFCFLAVATIVTGAALLAGVPSTVAVLLGTAIVIAQTLLLTSSGVVRSGYASGLAAMLSAAALVSLAFARWVGGRWSGSAPWAFGAVLAAALVQWVAGTAPMMVVSDVVFHAHKLASVAAGDLFPTSLTPDEQPFRFPYGVSFYALLAPMARVGIDPIALVRHGAALSGVVSSMVLFAMLAGEGSRRAGFATIALQLLPTTFDLYSFGNLSNVFGQAVTVTFFAWWAAPRAVPWVVGAALLALGCLAHLSSLIVLVVLCAALVVVRWRELRVDRARLMAVGIGFAIAGLYYARFAGLVVEQLSRLGEGQSASRPVWAAFLRQARLAIDAWGWPATALALLGAPRPRGGRLDADLLAFWIAGAGLAILAVLSPLEVRYLHALTLPLAVAVALGADRMMERGPAGRFLAWALLVGQSAVAVGGIVEGILYRYR